MRVYQFIQGLSDCSPKIRLQVGHVRLTPFGKTNKIDSASTVVILVTSSSRVLSCQEDRLITAQGDVDEPDDLLMDSPAEPPLVATTPLTPQVLMDSSTDDSFISPPIICRTC